MDCVFRALLADANHADRLFDFLNAVLQRSTPIVSVLLRNPIQPSEFVHDGQIVVDVIATQATGETFQVEMQSCNHVALKERTLYAWATLYKGQLEKGDNYAELRPVVAIWLLGENSLRGATGFHHRFRVRDDVGRFELSRRNERAAVPTLRHKYPQTRRLPPVLSHRASAPDTERRRGPFVLSAHLR